MRLRTTLTTISSRLRSRPTPRDKPIPSGTSFQLTLYDLVKQMLATHPSWQVRDESGRWVCPYCCELTPVEINGPIGATVLHQIAGYIGLCSGFDERNPLACKPLEAVQRGVLQPVLREAMTRKVSDALGRFAVWRVVDADGSWLCPYCCSGIDEIAIDEWCGPNALDIADHLLLGCHAFRERRRPAQTSLQLWERAGLTGDLGEQLRVLRERQTEQERELTLAAKKQRSMLPQAPRYSGYEFALHYQPSGFLAGSFYDFVELGRNRLAIFAGEVRGEGIDAAMTASVCRKVISITARATSDPIAALIEANEEFYLDLEGQTDVALFYAVLDLEERKLTFVRAGHEPPLIYRPSGEERIAIASANGAPMGSVRGSLFRDALAVTELDLLPGDLLLIYNNTLCAAERSDGKSYGGERLAADLSELAIYGPQALLSGVSHRLSSFLGPVEGPDQLLLAISCDAEVAAEELPVLDFADFESDVLETEALETGALEAGA